MKRTIAWILALAAVAFLAALSTSIPSAVRAAEIPGPTTCGSCGPAVTFPPAAGSGVSLPGSPNASSRSSLDSAGSEILLGVTCNKNNAHPSGSDDGNTVGWVTRAGTVDTSQPNPGTKSQVYVRRLDGSLNTVMASASVVSSGVAGFAEFPRLSGDGDWMVFVSSSEKLTTEDDMEPQKWRDVFLYHVPTGTVERMSETTALGVNPFPDDGGNAHSLGIPSISVDGRYVAFQSQASDLQSYFDPCDVVTTLYLKKMNGKTRAKRVSHIYLRDRGTNLFSDADDCIEWITPGVAGGGCTMPDGPSFAPSVSANGCLIAFESEATNLTSTLVSTTVRQIYLHDRTTDTTVLVSHDPGGAPSNAGCTRTRISADGAWVVFETKGSNLVTGDTNGLVDVFAYEVATGTVTRLSLDATGGQLTQPAIGAEISGNGRFVTYTRANGSPNAYELYVIDRDVNDDGVYSGTLADTTTHQLSLDSGGGSADGWSGGWPYTLTTDGKYVWFMTIAQDLASGDSNCVGSSCSNPSYDCDDGRDVYRQQVY